MTSSSANRVFLAVAAAGVLFGGCAVAPRAPLVEAPETRSSLSVRLLPPDKASPQRAASSTIRFTASASGGGGGLSYEFRTVKGTEEVFRQAGPSPTWDWIPAEEGLYRVKVSARDALGNRAESGWSPPYEITREMGRDSLIAVLPVENLSGSASPVKAIRDALIGRMKRRGFRILDEATLESFMARHRVRYTGGVSRELGHSLRGEVGVEAVLIGSLDLYGEADPPRMALTLRLVSTGEKPVIRWMDSVSMAGNDAPGFLSLGLVRDPRKLLGNVTARAVDSLTDYLAEGRHRGAGDGGRIALSGRFRPRKAFGSPVRSADRGRTLTVAVLPIFEDSTRKHAGEIVRLQLLRNLVGRENLVVIDPGEIRAAFLTSRTILQGGLSLPQGDLLLELVDADLFFYGSVKEYQDGTPMSAPVVNFTCQVLDPRRKKVIWSSISHNRGDDGVYFFDLGKVNTAPAMLSAMVRKMIERIFMAPPGGTSEPVPPGQGRKTG